MEGGERGRGGGRERGREGRGREGEGGRGEGGRGEGGEGRGREGRGEGGSKRRRETKRGRSHVSSAGRCILANNLL